MVDLNIAASSICKSVLSFDELEKIRILTPAVIRVSQDIHVCIHRMFFVCLRPCTFESPLMIHHRGHAQRISSSFWVPWHSWIVSSPFYWLPPYRQMVWLWQLVTSPWGIRISKMPYSYLDLKQYCRTYSAILVCLNMPKMAKLEFHKDCKQICFMRRFWQFKIYVFW